MGIPARSIPAVFICLIVLMQAAPCDAGAYGDESRAPGDERAAPRAASLAISAELDALFYLPYSWVTISGRVTGQDGEPESNAIVAAGLWGGPPLGSTVSGVQGNYSLAIQSPGTPGNYTVNVTVEKDGLSARAEPILRVTAEPNSPPKISSIVRTPENVTPSDDVLVSAEVSDDHGVQNATLAYRTAGGAYIRVRMNATGPSRFTSSIPRQPVNISVDFYIEAWDGMLRTFHPPAAPTETESYRVVPGDPGREWVRLVAVLNMTECLVDRPLLATGYVRNDTGGPVAGARLALRFENSSQPAVECYTDERGVFQLPARAPAIPGDHSARVDCDFGPLSNTTTIKLRVRDLLAVTVYTSSASVESSGRLVVSGAVTRNDGSAAFGASVRVRFEGSKFWWDCKADQNGAYNVTVKAPGASGSYMLNVTATFAGIDGGTGIRVAVLDRPGKAPGETGLLLLAACALVLGLQNFVERRPT